MTTYSRRSFLELVGATVLGALSRPQLPEPARDFRIRTVTAGVPMRGVKDQDAIQAAIQFAESARDFFGNAYEVQTIRVATEPLAGYLPDWQNTTAIDAIRVLDQMAVDAGVMFNIGPILTGNENVPDFGSWAADLVQATYNTSFSCFVASRKHGRHPATIRTCAEAIKAIADVSPSGEGNFRFCATAFTPPGTPFFPAAYHSGPRSFSIGLESPGILQNALLGKTDQISAKRAMIASMNGALAPIDAMARELARESGWRYLGIDTSPAPGLDASIAQVVEDLSGAPFGSPATLAACATITGVLQGLDMRTFGYSGLMLPVLEDAVLAKRASEGRYDVSDLLLYSSVCGTGLDVVPLPGNVSATALEATISDVAALAERYEKPLSARLFPIPGRREGDMVDFENPFLTRCRVLGLKSGSLPSD